MSRPTVLLGLDTDPHPSSFDVLVAVDAGVEHLLPYGGVNAENVVPLVHGAIFTRGPADLHATAIAIGGSDLAAAEAVFDRVRSTFLGPLRVSVLLDPSGANTTAAATVVALGRHLRLAGATMAVLGATGPVGRRVARLLVGAGATVRVVSRNYQLANGMCKSLEPLATGAPPQPAVTASDDDWAHLLDGTAAVVACGPPGVELFPAQQRQRATSLRVAVDLNAVPPLGIAGMEPTDKATDRHGTVSYGALGVGGLKMNIHRAAIAQLFTRNDLVLDAEELLALGGELDSATNLPPARS